VREDGVKLPYEGVVRDVLLAAVGAHDKMSARQSRPAADVADLAVVALNAEVPLQRHAPVSILEG
jgi:hypothetical protein